MSTRVMLHDKNDGVVATGSVEELADIVVHDNRAFGLTAKNLATLGIQGAYKYTEVTHTKLRADDEVIPTLRVPTENDDAETK